MRDWPQTGGGAGARTGASDRGPTVFVKNKHLSIKLLLGRTLIHRHTKKFSFTVPSRPKFFFDR